jgi:hypothetical protein
LPRLGTPHTAPSIATDGVESQHPHTPLGALPAASKRGEAARLLRADAPNLHATCLPVLFLIAFYSYNSAERDLESSPFAPLGKQAAAVLPSPAVGSTPRAALAARPPPPLSGAQASCRPEGAPVDDSDGLVRGRTPHPWSMGERQSAAPQCRTAWASRKQVSSSARCLGGQASAAAAAAAAGPVVVAALAADEAVAACLRWVTLRLSLLLRRRWRAGPGVREQELRAQAKEREQEQETLWGGGGGLYHFRPLPQLSPLPRVA